MHCFITPTLALFIAICATNPTPAQSSKLLAEIENSVPIIGFGENALALDDIDGNGLPDIAVTSYYDRVTVFSLETQQVLYDLSGPSGSEFGSSLTLLPDINGDGVSEIAIGAPCFTTPTRHRAGAVYVVSGADGSLLYRLLGFGLDGLGSSLCTLTDIDSDGIPDFAAGAPGKPQASTGDGVVYVISSATGSTIARAEAVIRDDRLGISVCQIGDQDGDGIGDLAIGSGAHAHRVVFASSVTGQYLGAIGGVPQFSIGFGTSVAGSVNDPNRVYVGSPNASNGNGNVYIFDIATQTKLDQVSGGPGAQLGTACELVPDANGDGIPDLVVGAPAYETEPGVDRGAVVLLSGFDLSEIARHVGLSPSATGTAIATIGDFDSDGLPDALYAAPYQQRLGAPSFGAVGICGFNPYLESSESAVSVSLGGVIQFDLSFPSHFGSEQYRILISSSGAGPTSFGVDVPLTDDSVVRQSFNGSYSPASNPIAMSGILAQDGTGHASLEFLPNALPPAAIGRNIWIAAVVLDQSGAFASAASAESVVVFVP